MISNKIKTRDMDNERKLYTIAVFSENRVGLLNQISIIFTRRKLNIETLSVSPSSIEGIHKFTITTFSNRETMHKLVKTIEKIVDVLKAFYYTDDQLVFQEIALYKVPTNLLIDEPNLEVIIRKYNARVLDIAKGYTVIEKTGHNFETEALFEELKQYGILQFVRSGRVAITKAQEELVTNFIKDQENRKKRIEA